MSHNDEVPTPLFLIYLKVPRGPNNSRGYTAQLHYGDPDSSMNQYGGWREANEHRRIAKIKVPWEHRFNGIEALMMQYPCPPQEEQSA